MLTYHIHVLSENHFLFNLSLLKAISELHNSVRICFVMCINVYVRWCPLLL